MTSLLWSQESQQEKLEQRKEQIQKEIREKRKTFTIRKEKRKNGRERYRDSKQ